MTVKAAIALLFAVIACFAAGCGSSEPADPAAVYFETVRDINIEFQERGDELAAQFQSDAAAGSASDLLGLARILIERSIPVFDEFVASLDAIEPPPELLAVHENAVEGARGLAAALRDLHETSMQVDNFAELQPAVDEAFSGEALGRYVDACLTLEDLAIARGYSYNLPCQ